MLHNTFFIYFILRLLSLLDAIEYRKIILLLDLFIGDKEKRKLNKKWQTIYEAKYVDGLLMKPLKENRYVTFLNF